jgi:hypothetical protein
MYSRAAYFCHATSTCQPASFIPSKRYYRNASYPVLEKHNTFRGIRTPFVGDNSAHTSRLGSIIDSKPKGQVAGIRSIDKDVHALKEAC